MSIEEQLAKAEHKTHDNRRMHTPGPWRQGTGGNQMYVVGDGNSTNHVCSVTHNNIESKADLQLIICAPELLDFVESMITLLRNHGSALHGGKQLLDEAIDLVRKARGIKLNPELHPEMKYFMERAGVVGRPAIVDVVGNCPDGHEVDGATEVLRDIFKAAGYYPKEGE